MRSQENRKAKPTPLKEGEEAPVMALQTRTGRKGPARPAAAPRLLPEPGHAGLGRALGEGCAGQRELPAPREEQLLPNLPAQAVASKAFPLGRLPVPPLALPGVFFWGV